MKEDCHVDLSIKFWKKSTTGIACLWMQSGEHTGCALSSHLKKSIVRHLMKGGTGEERAKLYSICIYYLINDRLQSIGKLIVCNDENFYFVRKYLISMIGKCPFPIISIIEYRKELGRCIKSPADNFAAHYAKRGLSETKQGIGIKLNLVKITFSKVSEKWNELKA
ncbi:MAG: hypothetical protein WC852_01695 [Candidatus Nanoarchaeia archaeon]|jgi:hypothetical protein